MTNELVTAQDTSVGCFGSFDAMDRSLKTAEILSKSNIIPDTFRGKPGDVLIALDMAMRLDLNPLSVMQNIYIVHGKPAWSGAFCAALITLSGRYASFRYEEEDLADTVKDLGRKNRRCRVVASLPNGEHHTGSWIDLHLAVQEGWTKRPGSKWVTMADQMLRYRAATFFVRAYCPDALMGLREAQEEEDIYAARNQTVDVIETHANEPNPAPEKPKLAKKTSTAHKAFANMLHLAASREELRGVAQRIAAEFKGGEWEKDDLRAIYTERLEEFQGE